MGPHRVLDPYRVLSPHRVVGPHRVLSPGSRFSGMLLMNGFDKKKCYFFFKTKYNFIEKL